MSTILNRILVGAWLAVVCALPCRAAMYEVTDSQGFSTTDWTTWFQPNIPKFNQPGKVLTAVYFTLKVTAQVSGASVVDDTPNDIASLHVDSYGALYVLPVGGLPGTPPTGYLNIPSGWTLKGEANPTFDSDFTVLCVNPGQSYFFTTPAISPTDTQTGNSVDPGVLANFTGTGNVPINVGAWGASTAYGDTGNVTFSFGTQGKAEVTIGYDYMDVVPEPSTWFCGIALLGIGVGTSFYESRRRKAAPQS